MNKPWRSSNAGDRVACPNRLAWTLWIDGRTKSCGCPTHYLNSNGLLSDLQAMQVCLLLVQGQARPGPWSADSRTWSALVSILTGSQSSLSQGQWRRVCRTESPTAKLRLSMLFAYLT